MMWLTLAWKNLWRNKNRTAISVSAVFFAVILSVTANSLQDGVFDNFVKNMVSYYTGYIQVHQKGYWDHQVLDNALERSVRFETDAKRTLHVTAIAPRIESYALVTFREITKGCMVVGISPRDEDRITYLRNKVTEGNYFLRDDSPAVILAQGLSRRLGLSVGDTVYLIGQGYRGALAAGKYPIQAVVSFGSPELNDQLLFMPLLTAQEFYSAPNRLTSYVIGLESDQHLQSTAVALRRAAGGDREVMTWKEMMPEVDQHISMDKGSMYIITGILYLLISFGIFGTLLVMMVERRYEMGMLVAIGMKKGKLATLLLVESLLTVFMGLVLGLAASIPVVVYLKRNPIRIRGEMATAYRQFNFEPIFPASVEPSIFLTQGMIVLVIGIMLSMYPVVKALRTDAVKSMKK